MYEPLETEARHQIHERVSAPPSRTSPRSPRATASPSASAGSPTGSTTEAADSPRRLVVSGALTTERLDYRRRQERIATPRRQ